MVRRAPGAWHRARRHEVGRNGPGEYAPAAALAAEAERSDEAGGGATAFGRRDPRWLRGAVARQVARTDDAAAQRRGWQARAAVPRWRLRRSPAGPRGSDRPRTTRN